MKRRSLANGFTFTEVISAIVIFSIGIISLTNIQGQSVKIMDDNLQRSQALWISMSVLENIRNNIPGLDSLHYQNAANQARSDLETFCNGSYSTCQRENGTCDSQQIANLDMFHNLCDNQNIIDLQVTIACDPSCISGANINVTTSWASVSSLRFSTREEITNFIRHP